MLCLYIDRCKAYSSLPSICTLKQDPADSCCQIPDCGAYTPITGNKFTGTIPPKKFNLVPIGTHSVFYGSRENPNALQGTSSKVYKFLYFYDTSLSMVNSKINHQYSNTTVNLQIITHKVNKAVVDIISACTCTSYCKN